MKRIYPSRILPHSNWCIINKRDIHAHIRGFYALRLYEHTDNPSPDQYKNYFPANRFYKGISTILLSTQFRKRDIHWCIKNDDFNQLLNTSRTIRINKGDYKWIKRRKYIGTCIARILDMQLESNTFDKMQGLPTDVKQYCYVFNHEPTNGNFWHCDIYLAAVKQDNSIQILDDKQKNVTKNSVEKIAKKIRDAFMSDDILICTNDLKEYYIPKHIYRTH